MKRGLPLSWRILLWALVNLLLLAVLAWGLFRGQFGLGLDALLAGRAGDRLQSMADVLGGELAATPRSGWDEVIERTSNAYGLKLMVATPDGLHWAGEPMILPPSVRQRLGGRLIPDRTDRLGAEFRPNAGFRREGGRNPRNSQPDPSGQSPPPEPADQDWEPPPRPPGPRERAGPPPPGGPEMRRGGLPRRPRFFLRTGDPPQYWAGVPLPGLSTPGGRPVGAMLLAVSPTLTAGGWVVDPVPWLLGGFGAVILSILLWYPLVRGVTGSIRDLTSATERMADGKFDIPVKVKRADELGRLGIAVNHLSGRLDHFVHGQRRFLGDIAHELCSPLARMQLGASLMERAAQNDPALQERVQDVREEVELMTGLVNELLSFSKAGLQTRGVELRAVALLPLIKEMIAREAPSEPAVEVDIDPDIHVMAGPELLARAVANLLRNAFRYAGHAGPVSIHARKNTDPENTVSITVSDSGPGVPHDELERIFEPFYRPDSARTREAGGAGLGLAIVRTCVEACKGSVSARNRLPAGLEVTIRLQAVPAATDEAVESSS